MKKIDYPKMENSCEKLRKLCLEKVKAKYLEKNRDLSIERLEYELNVVRKQNSESAYLIVNDMLQNVMANEKDYCFRGTIASSLIAYLTGMSDIDPIYSEPKLYPEFFYGIDGERLPDFEINVSPELRGKLMEYFDNYSGPGNVIWRINDSGNIWGVYIVRENPFGEKYSERRDDFGINILEVSGQFNLKEGKSFETCKPKSLSGWVKCYGFEHSTGAWKDNAEVLYCSGKATFEDLIADREDVFEFLLKYGVERRKAYEITEKVRMGKVSAKGWDQESLEVMHRAEIPDWFLKSCEKIMYLFPRAHAMSYFSKYGE